MKFWIGIICWFVRHERSDCYSQMHVYEIFDLIATELETNAEILGDLYNVDQHELYTELLPLRVLYDWKAFAHFSDLARFVLLKNSDADYPLRFFLQLQTANVLSLR